ncbi:MAG: hypothetical protein R3A51_04410 [Nannocystaceae bacterium]
MGLLRSRVSPLCFGLALALGCSSDATTDTDASTSTTDATTEDATAATTIADTTAGSDATTTAGETEATTDDETEGTDTEGPAPLEYARGIRLTHVTVNQGVQVEIVQDGVEVAPADYSSIVIEGRPLAIRAHWTLHADFTPRELTGRLTLYRPDDTVYVDDFTVMVSGPSNDAALSKTFSWLLPAELVEPGARYRITAHEPDPELAVGEVSDPPPVLPLAGKGDLGITPGAMQMKVVLVPVLHQLDGCEQAPEITDEDVAAMREELEENNPIQEALVTVREPMPYSAPIGDQNMGFAPILTALAQQRAEDNPPENVYYYGLMESCDGYPPGLAGQANGIPSAPIKSLAHMRVSAGRFSGSGENAKSTFVHEVGHSQGRYHIRCSGGEAGIDPDYPHSNGRIGVWGFGIHDHELRSPTGARDYMTYCSNEWVSDYGWGLVVPVIAELTSWDSEASTPSAAAILAGALYPDGTSEFWTVRGDVPASDYTPGYALALETASGPVLVPAHVSPRADDPTLNVFAPLPAGTELQGVTLVERGAPRASAAGAAIRRLHE